MYYSSTCVWVCPSRSPAPGAPGADIEVVEGPFLQKIVQGGPGGMYTWSPPPPNVSIYKLFVSAPLTPQTHVFLIGLRI